MKCIILIMSLAINIVFSGGACVNFNSQLTGSSQCIDSTLTICNVDNSYVGTTTCTNSQVCGNSQCTDSPLTGCNLDNSCVDTITCTDSQVSGNSQCTDSTLTDCNLDNSYVETTTCTKSQYSSVSIRNSKTNNTRILGPGCSISTCTINGGVPAASAACSITGCTLTAM